jgi:hypothetical protein
MKILFVFLIASVSAFNALAEPLTTVAPKTFAAFMKKAIEAKDAPATCWYLGSAEGYIRALKNSGNEKAGQLMTSLQGAEGKCGGPDTMDVKATFTAEEWVRLSDLQKKLESAEL